MSGRGWRVRPIRAANGRVQCFAVEYRNLYGFWREWAAFPSFARAMTLAHRNARHRAEAAEEGS